MADASKRRGKKDIGINPPKDGGTIVVPPGQPDSQSYTVHFPDGTKHNFAGPGLGIVQRDGVLSVLDSKRLHAMFAPGQWLSVNHPPAPASSERSTSFVGNG